MVTEAAIPVSHQSLKSRVMLMAVHTERETQRHTLHDLSEVPIFSTARFWFVIRFQLYNAFRDNVYIYMRIYYIIILLLYAVNVFDAEHTCRSC